MEKIHIIAGKKTSHADARAIAQERGVPVAYFPYFPKPARHVVYPSKPAPPRS